MIKVYFPQESLYTGVNISGVEGNLIEVTCYPWVRISPIIHLTLDNGVVITMSDYDFSQIVEETVKKTLIGVDINEENR